MVISDTITLRECPFFRAETEHKTQLIYDDRMGMSLVVCSCGANGPPAFDGREAAAHWNRRTSDADIERLSQSVGRIAFNCDQRAEAALARVDELLANNNELHERVIEWRGKAEAADAR